MNDQNPPSLLVITVHKLFLSWAEVLLASIKTCSKPLFSWAKLVFTIFKYLGLILNVFLKQNPILISYKTNFCNKYGVFSNMVYFRYGVFLTWCFSNMVFFQHGVFHKNTIWWKNTIKIRYFLLKKVTIFKNTIKM